MFATKLLHVKNRINISLHFIGFTFFLFSCASQAPLGGGPKDETPPKLLSCNPENRSVNFTGKQIELFFDEFIALKSVQQKLVISPPTNTKPDVISKTRSVIIKFDEELLPNTTYTLNFSDAIADLNEANSIPDFHYSFSTGTSLDSFKISGIVKDAFSLKPEAGIFVMLYTGTDDSLPIKNSPYYLSKTNSTGNFTIENLKAGRYKIFALNDINSNLLFDMPTEKIAFLDSLIVPEIIRKTETDTLKKGTVFNADTLLIDSIVTFPVTLFKPDNIVLRAFEEDRQKQFVKSSNRNYKNKCFAQFNRKGLGPVSVAGINVKHFLVEQTKNNDSLTLWLSDSIEGSLDTVKFQITYAKKDSTDKIYTVTEPLIFPFQEKNKKNPDILKFNTTVNIQQDQQFVSSNNIRFQFSTPVTKFPIDSISLKEGKDSIFHKIKPEIVPDKLSPCVYYIKYPWKDEMKYRYRIGKGSIKDVFGNSCDSLNRSFKIYPADYYGTVTFILEGPDSTLTFELIDANGNNVKEWSEKTPYSKRIERLLPGKYRLRAYFDENKNGRWDNGFYINHIQPEKMFLNPDEINLRSNWEIEVKWKVKDIQ
jgi:hypothetical protein